MSIPQMLYYCKELDTIIFSRLWNGETFINVYAVFVIVFRRHSLDMDMLRIYLLILPPAASGTEQHVLLWCVSFT